MNAQLQCVYGGGKLPHSVFRGHELRIRRRKTIRSIIIASMITSILLCAYFGLEARLTTASPTTRNHASIAVSITAIENSAALDSEDTMLASDEPGGFARV